MARQLTDTEKEICAAVGISETTFIAAKGPKSQLEAFEHVIAEIGASRSESNLRSAAAKLSNATANAAAGFLTSTEIQICSQTGVSLAVFAVEKKRRAGTGTVLMAVRRAGAPPDRGNSSDGQLDAASCLKKAMAEIEAFLRKPDSLDSLQALVNAEAWVHQALRVAGSDHRTGLMRPAPPED